MSSLISVERRGRSAIVTIDNPPLNVMSASVLNGLVEAYKELENDQDISTVILTGAGERAFMAGADIKEFPTLLGGEGLKEVFLESHRKLSYLERYSKPTIAVLNGLTLGGGCELALTADMRVSEEHSKIGLPEIKLGIFPGGGGTQRLPRLIGAPKAKALMFSGEPIDANRALEIGLVDYVAPTGEGVEFALQIAEKFNQQSLVALGLIKKAVNEGSEGTLEEGLELEAQFFEEVFQAADSKEGVQAFLEKRAPAFTHR